MADPYFASVVLLCGNDNAADGTTTFVDQSSYARAITANGNVQYDTADAPTGMTSSILFDGVGDFLSALDAAEMELGSSDFTIEFMVKRSTAANQEYMGKRANGASVGSFALFNQSTTNCVAYMSSDNATWDIASNKLVSATTTPWTHIALCRQGSTFYPFNGGTLGTTWVSAAAVTDNSELLRIGSCAASFGFTGWMSNIRMTIGVARYTANFTPPSLPFPTTAVDPVVVTADTPKGRAEWLSDVGYTGFETRKKTEEDVRKMREELGIIPRRVIQDVATRQVERLETDQQKQFEELARELEVAGVKWEARYLEALALIREQLLNAEIAKRIKLKMNDTRLRALLLMAAA